MGASDVYHKTLKEYHVIIYFANKTEKNIYIPPSGGEWISLSSYKWSTEFVRDYIPLAGTKTEDNLSSFCFLQHITCSLKTSRRTLLSILFLPVFIYPKSVMWLEWSFRKSEYLLSEFEIINLKSWFIFLVSFCLVNSFIINLSDWELMLVYIMDFNLLEKNPVIVKLKNLIISC